MKIISKDKLAEIDGYLVIEETGDVVNPGAVVNEINELVDRHEFVTFLIKNKKEILSAKDPVEYNVEARQVPRLVYDEKVATPLLDEETEKREKIALEFIAAKVPEQIQADLDRLKGLAQWFEQDHVFYKHDAFLPQQMKGSLLELKKEDVIKIIKKYHDPEIRELAKKVRFNFKS